MSTEFFADFFNEHPIKGFLAEDEGNALFHYACDVAKLGPCLEIGSYCGKSTVYIGKACQQHNTVLYAVDHHRGSEEHQKGEEYHDHELYDAVNACMDSFPYFRRTLKLANIEDAVIPIVASSKLAACAWQTPLSLVFIDGGHSHEMARDDCISWAEQLCVGGVLAVHDIFPNPTDGGQGPWLAFEEVYRIGKFEKLDQVNSLGALRKIKT